MKRETRNYGTRLALSPSPYVFELKVGGSLCEKYKEEGYANTGVLVSQDEKRDTLSSL